MIDNPMNTADAPDEGPNQTINDNLCDGTILIGYGKQGHGMNGKDADLGRIGQCLVTKLETVDPTGEEEMRVDIHLRLYCSICAPSCEGMNIETVKKNASPELLEFFKGQGVDIDKLIDSDFDDPDHYEQLQIVVDYFQDQAQEIVCGMHHDTTRGDPFAIMWNDDAWEGGIDVKLTVPLSLEEYEAIEEGQSVDLREVGDRISKEIDGNEGGTPERDAMKLWEETIGEANDMINKLECYHRKDN